MGIGGPCDTAESGPGVALAGVADGGSDELDSFNGGACASFEGPELDEASFCAGSSELPFNGVAAAEAGLLTLAVPFA